VAASCQRYANVALEGPQPPSLKSTALLPYCVHYRIQHAATKHGHGVEQQYPDGGGLRARTWDNMSRGCQRPGCSQVATSSISIRISSHVTSMGVCVGVWLVFLCSGSVCGGRLLLVVVVWLVSLCCTLVPGTSLHQHQPFYLNHPMLQVTQGDMSNSQ
jgi:hypothetical protein